MANAHATTSMNAERESGESEEKGKTSTQHNIKWHLRFACNEQNGFFWCLVYKT